MVNTNYKENKEIKLTVREAYHIDVGKFIARLPSHIMQELDLEAGDIISIKGNTEAVALVMRSRDDENIIRMDSVLRKNAGTSLGEKVIVTKVKETKPAQKIVLSPLHDYKLSEQDRNYLADFFHEKLNYKPVVKGNQIVFKNEYNNLYLAYQITDVKPRGIVIINDNTEIKVSKDKSIKETSVPEVSYEDIGGLDSEIEAIREMVELPLKHPEVFKRLGISAPKGILLYGPPGTGKTLLAKAVAHEADANFYSIAGPEIISKFYGESEENLRKIFDEAEKNAPSIIFIDEIDAIAPKREEAKGEVERRVVAQLLTLMDGLKTRGNVVVIAATNRQDSIDPALRRPGRFDREISIKVPDEKARLSILQIHTRNMPLSKDVNLEKLANITVGYTGADLSALCKEAAMKALKRKMPEITKYSENTIPDAELQKLEVKMQDFLDAHKLIEPSAMREVLITTPKTTWQDIGGLDAIKKQLIETVELPFLYPEMYEKVGIKPPKGIILYGEPGTGKTLLAKAIANEANANFISIKGPELLSKWVGESEKRVRDIFKKARQVAPTIIFFDEFDSISHVRGASLTDVTERIVNQILTEMDGIESLDKVIVIAATNRLDLIDPALLRPGRFDLKIEIKKPEKQERLAIFKVHTKNMPLKDIDFNKLVELTEGMTGADIELICKEAGLNAIRSKTQDLFNNIENTREKRREVLDKINEELKEIRITMKDFERAIETLKKQNKK